MVDTGTVTTALFYAFFIGFIIFQRLGGYPEAWYRIRRIPYFVDYIRGPDKKYRRHVEQMVKIATNAGISLWHFGVGDYHLPDGEASLNTNGAPMWFHAWDEARAIPQYMDTEVGKDGKERRVFRPKVPPSILAAGMKTKVAIDIHRDEEAQKGPEPFKWTTTILLLLGIVVMVTVLYFEYNNFCGLHPHNC